jgi:small-conductance mechanosensitive channel
MKSMDRALYWVEYVIRHNGADHLKQSRNIPQSFIQYFLIDVCLVIITMIIISVFLIVKTTKYIVKIKKSKNIKKKKN